MTFYGKRDDKMSVKYYTNGELIDITDMMIKSTGGDPDEPLIYKNVLYNLDIPNYQDGSTTVANLGTSGKTITVRDCSKVGDAIHFEPKAAHSQIKINENPFIQNRFVFDFTINNVSTNEMEQYHRFFQITTLSELNRYFTLYSNKQTSDGHAFTVEIQNGIVVDNSHIEILDSDRMLNAWVVNPAYLTPNNFTTPHSFKFEFNNINNYILFTLDNSPCVKYPITSYGTAKTDAQNIIWGYTPYTYGAIMDMTKCTVIEKA